MAKFGSIDIINYMFGGDQILKVMQGADQTWPVSPYIWESGIISSPPNKFDIVVSGTGTLYFGDGSSLPYDGNTINLFHKYEAGFSGTIQVQGTLTTIYIDKLNVYHALSTIPSTVTNYYNTGVNESTGNLSDLKEGLRRFTLRGLHTVVCDISSIPSTIIEFIVSGDAILNASYTAGKVFSSDFEEFEFVPNSSASAGLTSVEVDNILIDFNNSNTASNLNNIQLSSLHNGQRTTTSDAAVTSLVAAGCTVITS